MKLQKTVMAAKNGFVAASKKEMESQTHDKSIIQSEEAFTKIKLEPQITKEFSNILTLKHSSNAEPNSGKSDTACGSIIKPQFGLECKRNIVCSRYVLDLSLPQSFQRIDATGTSDKVNIFNTKTIPYKLNSKSTNVVEIEQKLLELKKVEAEIQCPLGNYFNNDTAIDLSLRKPKKEVRKNIATEEAESTSHSNVSRQNNSTKESVGKSVTIKTKLEETYGRNQYSKEIQSKYDHNAVSLVENPMALQKSFKSIKGNGKKDLLKENSIALNEVIIKYENSYNPQDNKQDGSTQTNLCDNSYNPDLNTSLDDNIDTLSNANMDDKDLNDEPSIQSCGVYPNDPQFSLNKTTSEKVEDESSSLKRNSLTETNKKMKIKANPSKILRKPYKTRQKTSRKNTNLKEAIRKTSKKGRKPKTKQTSNCIKKESAFITGFLIKRRLKNLPKSTTTETCFEEKIEKRVACKKKFPKPFQLDNLMPEQHDIAIDLPKPIMFKQEFQADIRNAELYKQPAFQPFVRLKRLSSEALLVPLKTKRVRKSRSEEASFAGRRLNSCSQTTNDDNKDLIIHQAFSLNPQIKLKQLNCSYDHSYGQLSCDSCLTTPLSVTNDNHKDNWNDSESKCNNSQDLFSLFHHATPKHGSMISGNTDSGVSTSTPITLPRCDDNIRLLLQIAAERAFINNHLKEFGYSPIQFQLYNDSNELNIFLKYVIDKIDIN